MSDLISMTACEIADALAAREIAVADWLAIAYAITLTSCPAISIPCGLTAAGLPVGLQLVAPFGAETKLISAAAALEATLGMDPAPMDPR